MSARRVLVVEDDKHIVDLLRLYLEHDGFGVLKAYDGVSGLELARAQRPDLIILDLMLPRLDGIELTRRLRQESDVPIIMLTARSTERDKLNGLNLGADDYVTKPFSPREVVARVRTVLRRVRSEGDGDSGDVEAGPIRISAARHEVAVNGQFVDLTPTEFKLLQAFAGEPGRVFSRQQLIDKVFGHAFEGFERNIDVHVMNLRRKLGRAGAGDPIKTVYGVGYRFEEAPSA